MDLINTETELEEYLQTNTLDQVDEHGYTPLIYACFYAREDIALAMLEHGPDACALSHVGGIRRMSALTATMEYINPYHTTYNDVECRKINPVIMQILSFGPEACALNHIYYLDFTVLQLACVNGSGEVALEILRFGSEACNMYYETCRGNTVLYWAKREGLMDVVERIEELMIEDAEQLPEPVCKGQMN